MNKKFEIWTPPTLKTNWYISLMIKCNNHGVDAICWNSIMSIKKKISPTMSLIVLSLYLKFIIVEINSYVETYVNCWDLYYCKYWRWLVQFNDIILIGKIIHSYGRSPFSSHPITSIEVSKFSFERYANLYKGFTNVCLSKTILKNFLMEIWKSDWLSWQLFNFSKKKI